MAASGEPGPDQDPYPHRSPGPLDLVAGGLLESHGHRAGRLGHPIWLELSRLPRGGWQRTERPEAEGLLGRRAGPATDAVALVATGRLRPLDPAMELPAALAAARAGGLHMACVVDRHGRVGWRTNVPGPGPLGQAPTEGRMLDVLRRTLELPTPPPPRPFTYVEVAGWLAQIAARARDRRPAAAKGAGPTAGRCPPGPAPRRLRWPEIVALSPDWATTPAPATVTGPHAAHPQNGDEPSLVPTWEQARLICALGGGRAWLPEPALAAWMDEGMFARWVLSELPSPEELLASVRPYVTAEAARRLAHVMARTC